MSRAGAKAGLRTKQAAPPQPHHHHHHHHHHHSQHDMDTDDDTNAAPHTPTQSDMLNRVIAEQTPGPVDLRTPAVSKFKSVGGAQSAVGEPLKVFLRVKPVNENNACFAITPDGKTLTANAPEGSYASRRGETRSKFSFTKAFDEKASQAEVYDGIARPLVDAFLRDGRTSLLFAYGCTNAGKTHTITGPESDPGIVPRAFECIFKSIGAVSTYQDRCDLGQEKRSFDDFFRLEYGMQRDTVKLDPAYKHCVWLSYLEIYNEQVFDLLVEPTARDEKRDVLKVKEDKNRHVFVKGLKESLVRNVAAGMKLLQQGQKNRQVGATLLNHDSSRSHSVLQIKLVSIPRDVAREEIQANPDLIHYAKLSIVDLAGSERASRTQSQATRLREAANINLSLTTFHRCLEALRQQQVEQQQLAAQPRGRRGQSAAKPNGAITMAPFRESQLTRLFQDYFVGEGVASMIVNVNPLVAEFDETSQVLKMSALAQDVVIESRTDTGRGGAPQQPSAAIVAQQQEQMAQVRQAQAQLIRLQMQAAGGATYDAENQVVLDNDVFNALVEELDDLKDELLDASHEAAAIEARVRLEASNELAERLARLDDTFRVRLHSEVEAVEEKYRSKLAIAQRYQEHMHVRDSEKAGELHKAFEFVKAENEKLEQQLGALRQKLSDREALLAKTAEHTGMALGAVQAERARLESEMAANAERFDSVVASRQMENENLRAQLADAKQDAAAAKQDAARAEAESRRLATQVKHLMEERDALQSECNDWRKQMSGASAKSRQAPKANKEVVEQAPPPKRRLRSRQALDKSPNNKKAAETDAASTAATAGDNVDDEYMLKDGQMLWKGAVDMSVTGQGISVTFAEPVPVDVDEPVAHDDDDHGFGNMNNDNADDSDDEDEHTATRFATVKMMDDSMLFSAVASPAIKTPMPKARSTEKVSEKVPTALRSRARTVGCENDPDSPVAAASPVVQRAQQAPPKSVKKVQTSISQFAKPAVVVQPAMMAESADAANDWSDVTLSEKALSSSISASGATTSTSGARRRFFPATYSKKASAPSSIADQKTLDAAFGFSSSKDRAAANKHAVVTKFQRPSSQRTIDAPAGPAPVRGKSGGVARLGKAFMNKLRGANEDEEEDDIEDGESGAKKVRRKPAFRRQPSKAAWSEAGEVENRNAQGSPY